MTACTICLYANSQASLRGELEDNSRVGGVGNRFQQSELPEKSIPHEVNPQNSKHLNVQLFCSWFG